ncbi:hypothetical protein GGR52DRAFT_379225 [Hypoxylon sp. FL1284]|nr:hypothetical protein GGR52DRAFT_379225 [Hypoxylon sp. FL1284]
MPGMSRIRPTRLGIFVVHLPASTCRRNRQAQQTQIRQDGEHEGLFTMRPSFAVRQCAGAPKHSSSSGTEHMNAALTASVVLPHPPADPELATGVFVALCIFGTACALGLAVLAACCLWQRIQQLRRTRRAAAAARKRNAHYFYLGMPPAQYPGFEHRRGYVDSGGGEGGGISSHLFSRSATGNSANTGNTGGASDAPDACNSATAYDPVELPVDSAAVELATYLYRHRG